LSDDWKQSSLEQKSNETPKRNAFALLQIIKQKNKRELKKKLTSFAAETKCKQKAK